MKERVIQNKILLSLSKHFYGRGIFWTNDTGTARSMDGKRVISFGLKGSSDILGCLDGRMICIEVKTESGKQRLDQKKFQTAIEGVGGIYLIARSPEEVIACLDSLN